jgi:pimeloyl-ACP methyl ester carboxylesterase
MASGSLIQFWVAQEGLKTERLHFIGDDAYIPAILVNPNAKGSFPAIILLHGYGSRKELVLPTALELGKAGFKVLVPDLRGHGDYARIPSDFGGEERFDIVRAIDYLASLRDVDDTKIALMGSSYGAMNAIIAGGIDDRIKTVVASSSPSNLTRWLAQQDWDGEERHSYIRHRQIVDDREEENYRSPVAYVEKIPSLLIFHGDADHLVPVSHAKELFNHASNVSRLRIIRGGEHDLPREVVLPEAIEWLSDKLEVDATIPKFPLNTYGSILGMGIFYLGLGLFIAASSWFFQALLPPKPPIETTARPQANFLKETALWGASYSLLTVVSLILVNEAEIENVTLSSLLLGKLALGIIIAGYFWRDFREKSNNRELKILNKEFVRQLASFLLGLLCVLIVWLFHAFLARLLFYPFSDMAVITSFPEIYWIIGITVVVDEIWFRQAFQSHVLETSGEFTDKEVVAISSLFYLVVKLITVVMIEIYFNLLTVRWLIAIFGLFLFIGTLGAILKKYKGLCASMTFSSLVHSTIYIALALTILL